MASQQFRLALDTNVLLAAFIARGLCADLLALLLRLQLDGKANSMVSAPVLAEFQKHLQGKFKASAAQIEAAMRALEPFESYAISTSLSSAAFELQAVPDPDDIPVLHAALGWQASHFLTGDKALWPLSPLHGLQIVSPREAFAMLHAAA
jgi:uncharacterized protein